MKLENTLLTGDSPPTVKLCDFGVARKFRKEESMRSNTLVGSPGYLAPDIVGKAIAGDHVSTYDVVKSDVWSCGVLLVLMLVQHFPYDFEKIAQYAASSGQAMRQMWTVEMNSQWRDATTLPSGCKLSDEVCDLLDKIFIVEPEERLSIDGIRQHPWCLRQLPPHLQDKLDSLAAEQQVGKGLVGWC